MTRTEALIELRDKAQAGAFGSPDTPHADLPVTHLIQAYCGSLDAAKALHETVLPGWAWAVKTLATDACQVWLDSAYGLRRIGYIGTAKDPARAWLLAILEALIAQEQGK
jgi:hypothetical protein